MLRIVARITRATPGLKPPERKQLARDLYDKLIKKLGAEPSRPVQRFVSQTLRQKLYNHYEPNLQPLYDRYFNGQSIFHPPSNAPRTADDAQLAYERTHEIARVIDKAKLVPPRIVKHVISRDPFATRPSTMASPKIAEPVTTAGSPS